MCVYIFIYIRPMNRTLLTPSGGRCSLRAPFFKKDSVTRAWRDTDFSLRKGNRLYLKSSMLA